MTPEDRARLRTLSTALLDDGLTPAEHVEYDQLVNKCLNEAMPTDDTPAADRNTTTHIEQRLLTLLNQLEAARTSRDGINWEAAATEADLLCDVADRLISITRTRMTAIHHLRLLGQSDEKAAARTLRTIAFRKEEA